MTAQDDLKKAWQWLKVTTPYQQMIDCPTQKAILTAIARNMKKQVRHERLASSRKRWTD